MLAPSLNCAALAGPQIFDWWQDWRGKPCAIVASGSSTKSAGVERLRGKLPVLAIKENAVDLCPWADVVYGCDLPWWKHRRGLPDFKGVRIGYDPRIRELYPDVNLIRIPETRNRGVDAFANEMMFEEPGVIGGGCNSGFQALNIAAQFGSQRILLVGFDMSLRGGAHWYGRNNWVKANNPDQPAVTRWCRHMTVASDVLRRMGIEVVNASPHSALACFPKMTIAAALQRWGL